MGMRGVALPLGGLLHTEQKRLWLVPTLNALKAAAPGSNHFLHRIATPNHTETSCDFF